MRPHRFGLPVLRVVSVCVHAIATTPAEPRSLVALPNSPGQARLTRRRPSLFLSQVGFRITLFEACSAFTHVTACRFAEPLKRPFDIEGFDSFVTSTAAPTASGWSDQLPGGTCTHEKPTPSHGALNNPG